MWKGQARELEAEALETLLRLRIIGLRFRSRLLLSVKIKSGPPLDLGRGCKFEDGEGAFLHRAPRRAKIAHHLGVHESCRMQRVDGDAATFELLCEVDREQDLRDFALAVGAYAAVFAREHNVAEIDCLLSERRNVDYASGRTLFQERQEGSVSRKPAR
jgi:hypothetical protein